MNLLHALKQSATEYHQPYPHWIVGQPVTPEVLTEVVNTMHGRGPQKFDGAGTAEHAGPGLNANLHRSVTSETVGEFPAIEKLIGELTAPETVMQFEQMLRRDFSGAWLKVDVLADFDGYWVKPQNDSADKLMSMMVYVNIWGEAGELGTDLYDTELNFVKTIPYRNNQGFVYAPGNHTWHGLEKKKIRTVRRAIQIDYVTFETSWKLPDLRNELSAA